MALVFLSLCSLPFSLLLSLSCSLLSLPLLLFPSLAFSNVLSPSLSFFPFHSPLFSFSPFLLSFSLLHSLSLPFVPIRFLSLSPFPSLSSFSLSFSFFSFFLVVLVVFNQQRLLNVLFPPLTDWYVPHKINDRPWPAPGPRGVNTGAWQLDCKRDPSYYLAQPLPTCDCDTVITILLRF